MDKKSLIALTVASLLSGCGGGDEGGGNTPSGTLTISGVITIRALDGYYQNALVFDDVNSNGALDINSDTILGLTNSQGVLSVNYTDEFTVQGTLAVQTLIPGGSVQSQLAALDSSVYAGIYTIDTDYPANSLDTEFVLSAPTESITSVTSQSLSAVVSPITDLISILSTPSQTTEQAKSQVATILGLTENQLFSDYLDASNLQIHKQAQTLATSKRYNPSRYTLAAANIATETAHIVNSMSSEQLNDTTYVPIVTTDDAGSPSVISNYVATVDNDNFNAIQAQLNNLNAQAGVAINTISIELSDLFKDNDIDSSVIPSITLESSQNLASSGISLSLNGTMLTLSADQVTTNDDLTISLSIEDIASDHLTALGKATATFTLPVQALAVNSSSKTSVQTGLDEITFTLGNNHEYSFSIPSLFYNVESDNLTYSVSPDSLNGLTVTLSEDGTVTLSGTPTQTASNMTFTVYVSNDVASNSASFTFDILDATSLAWDQANWNESNWQ